MSSLRRLGGLAQLARCSCGGAAAPTAGLVNEAPGTFGWPVPLHAAGFPGPTPPGCQSRRHNSTRAGPLDDLLTSTPSPAAGLPGPASCSPAPSIASDWCAAPIPAAAHASSAAAAGPLADAAPLALAPCPSPTLAAASSLEDSLALFLSPTQLSVQLWEGAHAASGLPWWAAIPATTLALRAALLPLSLRAYAASANVALLHQAFGLSGAVAEAVTHAARQQQQQQQQQQQGRQGQQQGEEADARGQLASGGGAGAGGGGPAGGMELRRLDLVRRVFAHLRAQHGAPSFGWYLGNAAVQVPLLVSLTLALRRMSGSLWPGFTGEGALYFPDLTAPPLYLQTLSTPYGTAGAILPLALVLLYVSAADRSAGGSSPGINMALKLLVLPLYCGALMQPHAVLLHWLAQAASQLGVYSLAAGVPALRRAAGVPELLTAMPTPRAPPADAGAAAAATVDELLLALSESYSKSGNTAAAQACLRALLARRPGHESAEERLRALLPAAAAADTTATAAADK